MTPAVSVPALPAYRSGDLRQAWRPMWHASLVYLLRGPLLREVNQNDRAES